MSILRTIVLEIQGHEAQASKYLKLASDNLAVAMSEHCETEASRSRKQEYLGYAEDYSLFAKTELTKAYNLNHLNR